MDDIPFTALCLFVLFGTNWVLYGCLWLHEEFSACKRWMDTSDANHGLLAKPSDAVDTEADPATVGSGRHGKVLSQPLSRSLTSVRNFSRELSRLGVVITFAYLCERHPPFPHSKKDHDMDMFWCMAFMLLIASVLNIRKSKSSEVLNREQTEEWKGWMQFMFLNYHYFSAHEAYNSIRVFITAYVWMTGFGNFSFFYLKGDYGAVRVLQMLWRLNFTVFFLCMVMDNHYILYYICPLHTFYFLVVYAVMSPARSANYTKNGIRWKLLIAALVISAVWDWNFGLFDKIFWFLGRDKIVGARSGTMWEWYFRSSLDHWSTFLGMIFALNYPSTSLWVKIVEALPRGRQWLVKSAASTVLLAATGWWAAHVLPAEKYIYNTKNAYFGVVVPVLTYIFMRNLTPLVRSRYLEPMHSLGKITLETYLMQHHIWLTSNAKTLLVLIPGWPKFNCIVVGCCYLLVSRELYRLTMSLRGMCLPDNLDACIRNLAGIAVTFFLSAFVSAVLRLVQASPAASIIAIGVVGFVVVAVVHILLCNAATQSGDGESKVMSTYGEYKASSSAARRKEYDRRLLHPAHIGPVLIALLAVATGVALQEPPPSASNNHGPGVANMHECVESASHGIWKVSYGACPEREETSYCSTHEWKWVDIPDQCQLHYLPPSDVKTVLSGRRVIVVGDSVERFVYYSLIRSLGGETPLAHDHSVEKHKDFQWESDDERKIRISFLWAPFARDLAARVADLYTREDFDVLLMGTGLWDALHSSGDVTPYAEGINALLQTLTGKPSIAKAPLKFWIFRSATFPSLLDSDEKREWLTAENLASVDAATRSSGLLSTVDGVVDGFKLTDGQKSQSYDGIHYSDLIYDAFAQVSVNLVQYITRSAPPSSNDDPKVKEIAGMGSAFLGLFVLFVSSVMVLSRDSFNGIPRLALGLFGGRYFDPTSMDWESTYGELLRKIGKHPIAPFNSDASPSSKRSYLKVGDMKDRVEARKGGDEVSGKNSYSPERKRGNVVVDSAEESLLLEARAENRRFLEMTEQS